MSAVGEALAVVSCVAGLIQAYDAGTRVIGQIKKRRQARGALPPSDLLEESVQDGREELQKLVEKGSKRYNISYENADGRPSIASNSATAH